MTLGNFTKRKFLAFPIEQQHKKCAELLRAIYEKKNCGISHFEEIETYADLADWMKIPLQNLSSSKILSDLYHEHVKKAFLKHKEHNLLPLVRKNDKETAQKSWDISIYLDNLRSAHNVGSLLRTVEAFSLGDVHFSNATPDCSNKQVQDAAMGAEKWVKCFSNSDLKKLKHPIIAMETSESAVSIFDFIFPETFTLVLGNEEYGCSDQTLQLADIIIEIPLRGRKNSLNVANAFAIAAAEIYRQKTLQSCLKVEKSREG